MVNFRVSQVEGHRGAESFRFSLPERGVVLAGSRYGTADPKTCRDLVEGLAGKHFSFLLGLCRRGRPELQESVGGIRDAGADVCRLCVQRAYRAFSFLQVLFLGGGAMRADSESGAAPKN